MKEVIEQIENVRNFWLTSELIPSDLSVWGIKDLDKEKVAYALDECKNLVHKLQEVNWQTPVTLSLYRAKHYLSLLTAFVTTTLSQPDPQKKIADFINNLYWLMIVLRSAAVFSSDKVYNAEGELLKVSQQIEASKPILDNIMEISDTAAKAKDGCANALKEVVENEKSVSEMTKNVTKLLTDVTASSEQIKNIAVKATQEVEQVSSHKTEISSLNSAYVTLLEKCKVESENLKKMDEKNKLQQEEIQKTIQDASRLGMAGSFRMRKKELTIPMIGWVVLFIVGIASMGWIGINEIVPLLKKDGPIDWLAFLGRVPLLAPAIWVAWFSVKQFGYTVRLWEDYAFKYASAMAFEGYKREAANVSEDMLKLLLEISIINFSSNPLRVYSGTIHTSPLHELTDDSKGLLQRFQDIIKPVKK